MHATALFFGVRQMARKARRRGELAPKGELIGYACVSTSEQDTYAQVDVLKAAGCKRIFRDVASGGDRERPELARAITSSGAGDTLVVARLDRLARSLSHLLELTEGLRAKGAHFRSLADPFDTASPQGMLMMQMLGCVRRVRAGVDPGEDEVRHCRRRRPWRQAR